MSQLVRKISDKLQVIGIIDPDAYGTGEQLTAAIDMADYQCVMAIVMAGTLGSSATVDAAATDSAASGGTYAAISGKAITQLTQAGTDSDKVALINLRSDELNSGARYVKFSLTVGTATSDAGLIVLGVPRYSTEADLAAVDEIVA